MFKTTLEVEVEVVVKIGSGTEFRSWECISEEDITQL